MKEEQDLEKIKIKLLSYIKIIKEKYPQYFSLNLNNDLVKFNESNTVSFLCKDNILYLPKKAYNFFEKLNTSSNNLGIKKTGVKEEDYLNTNTDYYDYINYIISEKLSAYDYFEESLLHEAMHLCGSGGGSPLTEGINELKTRELAKEYHIKIAAMGYPKEVAIAKKLQDIVGKDVMDELAFKNYNTVVSYEFLLNKCGKEIADLYQKIVLTMENYSDFMQHLVDASDPFEKARLYEQINYSDVDKILEEYLNNFRKVR